MGPLVDCGGPLMVHNERDSAAESFNPVELLDLCSTRFQRLDSHGTCVVPLCAETGGTQISHKNSMGKFNNVLWTTGIIISAVQGLRFSQSEKKPQQNDSSAKRRDKMIDHDASTTFE